MLSNLFISKVRIKMLEQFLLNPGEEYHVRGLVRLLDEEINAIRRELQNLTDIGLLISKKKGNKLFYRLVEDHLLKVELRNLIFKDREDVQTIYTQLLKVDNLEIAVLTANFLNSTYQKKEDIDLFLVGDVVVEDLTKVLRQLEEKLERELRVTLMNQQDLEFHHKKRDDFLLNILRTDKIMLVGSENDLY